MTATCESCGQPVRSAEDVIAGRASYEDTAGGHADRHTLVVEEAERAATSVSVGKTDDDLRNTDG